MSVVICDIEMPLSCHECPFRVYGLLSYDEDFSRCVATYGTPPVELPTTSRRSAFCPLEEVIDPEWEQDYGRR